MNSVQLDKKRNDIFNNYNMENNNYIVNIREKNEKEEVVPIKSKKFTKQSVKEQNEEKEKLSHSYKKDYFLRNKVIPISKKILY